MGSSFYCVAATYNLEGKTVPFFRGTVATVYNYANHGEVNGPLVNAKNMTLCARAVNNEDASNGAGLWLFTRNPVATKAQFGAMHAALKAQDIATSRLHPVERHGCNYHGATLK